MISVLVLEDDEKLNYIVRLYLNDNGYNAISCKNAREAFDKMLEKTVDIIISNIMMPEIDGFEFAREIRSQDKTIPILFMTARDDITSKQKKYHIGIDDFNKMIEELATIETLKGDFITNISHEIKTPLAVIQSYASIMLKKSLPIDKRMDYINAILSESKKLSTLVTAVLKLNRLDNQEIIKKHTYSLDEQLRCSILALEGKFEEKDIMLDVELDEVMITTD